MTYILEQLLAVRNHREIRALNELAQSKVKFHQATDRKRRKEKELVDFRQQRLLEEQNLFAKLKSEPSTVHDLLHFTDTVNTLRNDQCAIARQVDDASNQVVAAENDMNTARQRHNETCRHKEKIEEHKSIWMESDRRQSEMKSENEMEELAQTNLIR